MRPTNLYRVPVRVTDSGDSKMHLNQPRMVSHSGKVAGRGCGESVWNLAADAAGDWMATVHSSMFSGSKL